MKNWIGKHIFVLRIQADQGYGMLMEQYKYLFVGLSCLTDKHSMQINKAVPPVIHLCKEAVAGSYPCVTLLGFGARKQKYQHYFQAHQQALLFWLQFISIMQACILFMGLFLQILVYSFFFLDLVPPWWHKIRQACTMVPV